MSWISNNRSFIRITVFLSLIVSLAGPWAFDVINVPAEYPCNKPFIRLEGDYCGYPMSGFQLFFFLTGGLFNIVAGWIQGNFIGRGRELVAILLGLILFPPFFSALLAIWKKDSRRWQSINLITWGLTCILLLHYTLLLSQSREQFLHAWGLWIYIITAIGTIIFEILVLGSDARTNRDHYDTTTRVNM